MFVFTPILLIVDEEKDLQLDLRMLFLPTTVAWALLVIATIVIHKKINKFHKRVLELVINSKQYVNLLNQGSPNGRCTKHCQKYTRSQFEVRFLTYLCYAMLFLYFGLFFKLYVFDWLQESEMLPDPINFELKWVHVSLISYIPVFIMYVKEICNEAIKSKNNLKDNQEMLLNCISLSINKSMTDNQIIDKFGK